MKFSRKTFYNVVLGVAIAAANAQAHPVSFRSSITYSASPPTGAAGSVSNWTGAAFDADNVGGSGQNMDGEAGNGPTNDAATMVGPGHPTQGQTFRTGSATHGYRLNAVTVRLAAYPQNLASEQNGTGWNLHAANWPISLTLGERKGTTRALRFIQNYMPGATGNSGAGHSVNGAGTYLTFQMPVTVLLKPDTEYTVELSSSQGAHFEWAGIRTDVFTGGTAFTLGSEDVMLPHQGDRVFMADLTALDQPSALVSPGTLHTRADLERMKAKIAEGAQPWTQGYEILQSSPYASTGWRIRPFQTIIRGVPGNNYTPSQQDAQAIYSLALRWHLSGDTAYANHAVKIANAWAQTLKGVGGNSNWALGSGLCGYLFGIGGELLSSYPGWAEADREAYRDMMMKVFYAGNLAFLWIHNGTGRFGGNSHYRLNWDTANMASMASIGVLCDNRAVYEQALEFFKFGPGNGRIERAAWYLHPDGSAQTEEVGRDQGHNVGGWYSMALLCQIAWNQGDDLWTYDNGRVLRALETTAKHNLKYDVPWVFHRNTSSGTETISMGDRGRFGMFHELAFHHYVNVRGMAAPYTQMAAERMRPEPWPNTRVHPSCVDWFGLGTLTFTRDPIATSTPPQGLCANWSADRITLNWLGSANATGYTIKRAPSVDGAYSVIGNADALDLAFIDVAITNGGTYFYRVSATTPGGETPDSPPLKVQQALAAHYDFDGDWRDAAGGRDGSPRGGSTGAPGWTAGREGQALALDGVDDFVELPNGIANYQDLTVAAWILWNGGGAWQRVFDFGSEIEKSMFLTPSNGSKLQFTITTSRGAEGTGNLYGPAPATGQWVHVAVTLNGDAGTLYVNGVPADSQVIDKVDPLFSQVFCYLGRSMYTPDPLFSGAIDDFRIYNYALSGAAIYRLWDPLAPAPPTFSARSFSTTAATEDAKYVGATIADQAIAPAGETLTFHKAAGPAWLEIAADGALGGTPANADVGTNACLVRVHTPAGATDDATLWIVVANANDAPQWGTNVVAGDAVTVGQSYAGNVADAKPSDVDAGDALVFSKAAGPAWLAVAADGQLSGTPGASDAGANHFTVRVTDSAGAIADMALAVPVLGRGLWAHLTLDGHARDGQGNNPGMTNGVLRIAPGRVDRAAGFDGATAWIGLTQALAPMVFGEITVAGWVNWEGGSAWQRIFDFGNGQGAYLFLTPSSPEGRLRFAIRNGGPEEVLETAALATNRWMHVAVTLGGGEGKLYVDGDLRDTRPMTITAGDVAPRSNYLGKSQFGQDPLFRGRLDDVRIYNGVLTDKAIARVAGRAGMP